MPLEIKVMSSTKRDCHRSIDGKRCRRRFESSIVSLLKTRAGSLETEPIQRVMRRLAEDYPGPVTEPLPPPKVLEDAEPALIEIVLLPPGALEFRGYEVRTARHPADGEAGRSGPCREGGIRLDLDAGGSVAGFLGEVLDALGEWNLDAGPVILLFRVPENLFLHPFDADWKHPDTNLPIGYDYPVAVAPHWVRRHHQLWQQFGNRIASRLKQPLRNGIYWASSAAWPDKTPDRAKLVDGMDESACVALEKAPIRGNREPF